MAIVVSSDPPRVGIIRASRYSIRRVAHYIYNLFQTVHLRLCMAQLLVRCIPFGAAGNVRSAIYRLAGFTDIGPKVYLFGPTDLRAMGKIHHKLHIGRACYINSPCTMELGADIFIGDRVCIGHNTIIMTTTHEIGSSERRCGALDSKPVRIGDGAWIGAGAMVMPGVTIGHGAIVVAGAMVAHDVPANTKVAGNPARVIAHLD